MYWHSFLARNILSVTTDQKKIHLMPQNGFGRFQCPILQTRTYH
jgi:hypothetical protein